MPLRRCWKRCFGQQDSDRLGKTPGLSESRGKTIAAEVFGTKRAETARLAEDFPLLAAAVDRSPTDDQRKADALILEVLGDGKLCTAHESILNLGEAAGLDGIIATLCAFWRFGEASSVGSRSCNGSAHGVKAAMDLFQQPPGAALGWALLPPDDLEGPCLVFGWPRLVFELFPFRSWGPLLVMSCCPIEVDESLRDSKIRCLSYTHKFPWAVCRACDLVRLEESETLAMLCQRRPVRRQPPGNPPDAQLAAELSDYLNELAGPGNLYLSLFRYVERVLGERAVPAEAAVSVGSQEDADAIFAALGATSQAVAQQMRWCSQAWSSLQATFSYGVPTDEAIRIAGSYGPVVHAGAESGYWVSLLERAGYTAKGLDMLRSNDHLRAASVSTGGPEQLAEEQQSAVLLLVHPDSHAEGDFAVRCLKFFRGDYVVYVGELEQEQHLLSALFEPARKERLRLPCRWEVRSDLSVWRRKKS